MELMLLIPLIGGSIVKVGMGVIMVEGSPDAVTGLNLKIPANLTLSIDEEKDTGPFIKTPLSLFTATAFGPDASILFCPSNIKKLEDEAFSFMIFILFS